MNLSPYRAADVPPPEPPPERRCLGCLHHVHRGRCRECGSFCVVQTLTTTAIGAVAACAVVAGATFLAAGWYELSISSQPYPGVRTPPREWISLLYLPGIFALFVLALWLDGFAARVRARRMYPDASAAPADSPVRVESAGDSGASTEVTESESDASVHDCGHARARESAGV